MKRTVIYSSSRSYKKDQIDNRRQVHFQKALDRYEEAEPIETHNSCRCNGRDGDNCKKAKYPKAVMRSTRDEDES